METAEPTATATPTPTATPTATPTPTPTASPTPTATPTPTQSRLSTESFWSERLAAHEQTLRNASSFSAAQSVKVSGPEEAIGANEQNVTVVLIANGSERYQERRFEDRRVGRYKPDGESPIYVRQNRSGNVSYSKTSGSIPIRSVYSPAQASWFASFNYTDEGVVSTSRGERRKVSVTSVDADSSIGDSYNGELTDVQMDVFFHPEQDRITRILYSVELERDNGTVTLATAFLVRDVGASTYEPPEWLDEAKSSTD